MLLPYQLDTTIAAIATPSGSSALAIIRLTGNSAITIVNTMFKGKDLSKVESHTIHYGYIVDNNKLIDEVMVTVLKAPRTFTKEDMVEISCHGSNYIAQSVWNLCLKNGAAPAQPGEFTFRAFTNGRIDLSQAESVSDLISAETESAANVALSQLKGGVKNELQKLRETLINMISLLELELDFAEEDVDFADRNQLSQLLKNISKETETLLHSFSMGNAMKTGISTALVGEPNAGKSTLLNAIINEERAIVSPIAGTTRDAIEETLTINGLGFRLVDTAGIRQSSDVIENMGIAKTLDYLTKANLVIWIIDGTKVMPDPLLIKGKINSQVKLVVYINKLDIMTPEQITICRQYIENNLLEGLIASAHNKEDILLLKQTMYKACVEDWNLQDKSPISNIRHKYQLEKVAYHVHQAQTLMEQNQTADWLSMELKQAVMYLGSITGEVEIDRDILGNIFQNFCIGK